MDIECKIHRNGGTKTTIETTEYHFAPLPDGAHVAAVDNEAHADRFLSISEAYKLYRGEGKAEKPTAKVVAPAPAAVDTQIPDHAPPELSTAHPASFEIGGKTYTATEIAYLAIEKAEITPAAWNELTDDERAEHFDVVLDALADADKDGDGDVDEKDERITLAAKYEAKHGKKPQWNMNIDKLRAAVAE